MKFTIDRDPLLSALTRTSGIVSRRSTIPILSALTRTSGIVSRRSTIPILTNVLLDAGASLTVRATDLDMEAVISVDCATETPGRITVPASSLSDIAKSLPEGAQIKCELVDNRLNVSAGRARWKLPTLDAAAFPDMGANSTKWTWEQTVTGTMLADLIARTSWAISTDESKQFIGGVRLSCDGRDLVAMATESHIMAIARMECAAPEFRGITVPGKTCAEIVKLVGEIPDLTLRMMEAKIGVQTDRATLTSSVIGLEFPTGGIEHVLKMARPQTVTLNRSQLASAIRRAMIGTDAQALGHYVRIVMHDGLMSVSGRSTHSEAADEIEIEYDGPEIVLGFNSEWLLDMAAKMKGETVTIALDAEKTTAPFLLQVSGDDSVICIGTPQKVA